MPNLKNRFALSSVRNDQDMDTIAQILKPVQELPGISGYLLCDLEGKSLASTLPSIYDDQTVKQINELLRQSQEILKISGQEMEDLLFQYQEGKFIVKIFNRGYLMVIAVKDLNYALFTLAAKLALKKLDEQGQDLAPHPENNVPAGPLVYASPDVLEDIKKKLARQIGPMANIIFKKNMTFPADKFPQYALEGFIRKMVEAIADENKRKIFQTEVLHYLFLKS